VMSRGEREDLMIKLRAELKEFKGRESSYSEKRKELRELELLYRGELDK
jgi:hypothetical protein